MILIETLISFGATICFAVLFSAPKKELPFCGCTGALGWLVYEALVQDGVSKVLASMAATAGRWALLHHLLPVYRRPLSACRKRT